jgi:hypothetical protein
MPSIKKMLVVTDATGRIVAAAHPHDGKPAKMTVGIAALPGQEIHEVDFPEELTRLKSGHDLHMALSHAKFQRATGKLVFPSITFKKVEH